MDVDLENIADVLRKANIRVTTVGERYLIWNVRRRRQNWPGTSRAR